MQHLPAYQSKQEKSKLFGENNLVYAKNQMQDTKALGDIEILWTIANLDQIKPGMWQAVEGILDQYFYLYTQQHKEKKAVVMPLLSNDVLISKLSQINKITLINAINNLFHKANIKYVVFTKKNRPDFNDAITVASAGDKGLGAFANEAFAAGSVIDEYTGEIKLLSGDEGEGIHNEFLRESAHRHLSQLLPTKTSDFMYVSGFLNKDPYFILSDDFRAQPNAFFSKIMIDASVHRNEMAFANTSRFPNMEAVRVLKLTLDDDNKICRGDFALFFIAKKDIKIGEELVWDYGYDIEKLRAFKHENIDIFDIRDENKCYTCDSDDIKITCDCGFGKYCSEQCQNLDKETHKKFCNPLSFCYGCNEQKVKLFKCTRCYQAAYCNKACQTKHWSTHKKTCNKK